MPKRIDTKDKKNSAKRKFKKAPEEHNNDKIKVPMKFKSAYIIFSLSKQTEVMNQLEGSANVRYNCQHLYPLSTRLNTPCLNYVY